MAPLLNEEEAALDPYAVLEVGTGASEKEIQRAYRKLSLRYHPDKNPTPEAEVMFRKISVSLALLVDSAKRGFLDTRLESNRRKKAQYAEMDKKRKKMVDDLNAREEEAKKAKIEQVQRRQQAAKEEEIKESGRKMLEEAQKAQLRAASAAASMGTATSTSYLAPSSGHPASNGIVNNNANGTSATQPPITPLDLTLVLQFPLSTPHAESSTSLQSSLQMRYGPISHLILKDPPLPDEGKKKKSKGKGKGKKAIVEFGKGNWGGCWACWKDHVEFEAETEDDVEGLSKGEGSGRGLEGVKAKWAGGKVPEWVEWASKSHHDEARRQLSSTAIPTAATAPATVTPSFSFSHQGSASQPANTFSSAPDTSQTTMASLLAQHSKDQESRSSAKKREDEFESMTLLRMRQAERRRMEEAIRLEEEEGE